MSRRRRRRRLGPQLRRAAAETVGRTRRFLTALLLLLQALVLLLLWMEEHTPPGDGLLRLLWVRNRFVLATFFGTLMIAGPILSMKIAVLGGRSRSVMIVGWALFLTAALWMRFEVVEALVEVIWSQRIEPLFR